MANFYQYRAYHYYFSFDFLIQNSQNRETRAVQLKLDEIIRATEGARNVMLRVEKLSDEELQLISSQYEKLAEEARRRVLMKKQI